MIYLCNVFSVGMLGHLETFGHRHADIERISAKEAGRILRENPFVSAFGHGWTAWHLSRYLHVDVPESRQEIQLGPDDLLIVASVVNKSRLLWRVEGAPRWVFYAVKIRENS